ncbi:MAG: hypothetical protein NTY07_06940 [Bacteroidia bacterium]|nr:hypothetical protein [Bacteroidia bacterium]
MKFIYTTLFMLVFFEMAYSQQDTIVTNSEKIVCSVKEITADAVKFTYPGEDLINTIYKNTIEKITFKSGRVQKFAEATSFKTVNGPEDFENVSITQVESEVKGLFKLANVSSKAKGTTSLSNIERVKERAYRKLKIEAAMQGANVIYLTQQQTQGNQMGTKYQAGKSTETNLDGVAYTNKIPKFEDFTAKIKNRNQFNVLATLKLWSGGTDMENDKFVGTLTINSVTNESGLIIINGTIPKIDQSRFRVVYLTDKNFVLVYEDKSTIYDLVFPL